ncbi:MAG: DUF2484 family protein [Pseudomonadota bacterium]
MTLSAVLACVWVLLSSAVALMPMRHQYVPGVTLLVAAPLLILWLAVDYGWIVGVVGLLGFVSMFRNPLLYLGRKAIGLPVRRPEDAVEARQ